MSELVKISQKFRRIGYGTEIRGDKLYVWESWEPECVLIMKLKTFSQALRARNNGLEYENNIVCISGRFLKGDSPKISESVFRLLKEHQTIKAGDYVKLISSTNPYVPSGSILKIESLTTVVDSKGEVQVFNVTYKGHPYSAHRRTIELANYTEPEKVEFT